MVAAGVPLDVGIRHAAGGFDSTLEATSMRLAERLANGASISEACQDEKSIPPIFRSVLVAGFSCGESEAVLEDVTRLTQMMVALRQSLKIGLVYPIIVVFLALGLFGFVLSTMIPQVASLYRQLHIEFPTWLNLASSIHLNAYHLMAFLLIFLFTIMQLWRSGRVTPLSGLKWIPGVSNVLHDFSIAHFAQLLSLLVKYGLPLPKSLRLTAQTLPSGVMQTQILELASLIDQGQQIAVAVERQSAFPPFLRWLLLAGHEDSELGNALHQAAEFYQGRARSRALWISQVVPAVAVVGVGGSVTLLYALTVFGPMIDLWSKLAIS